MDRWLSGGTVWAEWTFRGRALGVYEFDKNLNRADWILIHKHEEKKFLDNPKKMQMLEIPSTIPVPPLQVTIIIKRRIKLTSLELIAPIC